MGLGLGLGGVRGCQKGGRLRGSGPRRVARSTPARREASREISMVYSLSNHLGDMGEMQARCRRDLWEIYARSRGDLGEI